MKKLSCVSTFVLLAFTLTPALAKDKDRNDRVYERAQDRIEALQDKLDSGNLSEKQADHAQELIDKIVDKFNIELPPPPPPEEPPPTPHELFKDDFNRSSGIKSEWTTSTVNGAVVTCRDCEDEKVLRDAGGSIVYDANGNPVIIPAHGYMAMKQYEAISNHPVPAEASASVDLAGVSYDKFTISYDYATTLSSSNSKLTIYSTTDGVTYTEVAVHTLEGGNLSIWPDTMHNSVTVDGTGSDMFGWKFKAEGDPWVIVDNVVITGTPSFQEPLTQ